MPTETKHAVEWAMEQQYEIEPSYFINVSSQFPFTVVDKTREYFNTNKIEYDDFSFNDLESYL